MCGLSGFISVNGGTQSCLGAETSIRRMISQLAHRGPDGEGVWSDETKGVSLGHRRLSVLDLSAEGEQPMMSESGRYIIVYNGEVYNHKQLRKDLESRCAVRGWRGGSDTETLLAMFEFWGVRKTLPWLDGMFAFAVWDRHECRLTIARDRLGEKPLYYGWLGPSSKAHVFAFASELKALRAHPAFAQPVSRTALQLYLRCSYIPAPYSIYDKVYKLEPGSLLEINTLSRNQGGSERSLDDLIADSHCEVERWWSSTDCYKKTLGGDSEDELTSISLIERNLAQSVRSQMLSDVPIGAFLSGGIDSTLVTALLQTHSSESVKTFTVGFTESEYDESVYAKNVAHYLGTDHHELIVSPRDAQAVIPRLSQIYDEPFGDSSQIPTFLVANLARQSVTVALSGDGGDELFGGYNRYVIGPRLWSGFSRLTPTQRRILGITLGALPLGLWNQLGKFVSIAHLDTKVQRLSSRLGNVNSLDELYWSLVKEWSDSDTVVKGREGGNIDHVAGIKDIVFPSSLSESSRMMHYDLNTYLPGDILCKVDRAAMSCSLETRSPFLSASVVEAAMMLPDHMKIRDNVGKWVLRKILERYVPARLTDRPKVGFSIPLAGWLRGPLKDWAEDLLGERRLEAEGFFYPAPIRAAWMDHLSGRADNSSKVWSILMFQAWLSDTQQVTRISQ